MPVSQPLVSVYINSYNYGVFLKEAIESVLRQEFDSWELLLINSASTDDTEEIMKIYEGSPNVRYFNINSPDLRLAANLAIKESVGKYLIRLDADDVFDENILLILSNYLERQKEVGIVFPDYYLTNQAGEVIKHERWEKINRSNYIQNMPPNGACTMFRKSILSDIGGYREDLKAQDGFDVWTRIIKDHKCANINLPLFYYRRHHFNMTNDSQRILTARRTIQKDATADQLHQYQPIKVVIPCRSHYDFIGNLWKQEIAPNSLLDINIQTCLQSNIIQEIIVACDNPEVEEYIKKYNSPKLKFFKRTPRDTVNSISFGKTLEAIYHDFNFDESGITVISYLNTPFKTVDTLEESIFNLVLHQVDTSIAVEKIESQVYGRSAYGLKPLNKNGEISSDFSHVFRDSSTYVATLNKNIKSGRLFGPSVTNFLIPQKESFIIDSTINLEVARIISKQELSHG